MNINRYIFLAFLLLLCIVTGITYCRSARAAEKSRFMVRETFTVFSNGDGALLVDDKFGKEYILVKDVGMIQTR